MPDLVTLAQVKTNLGITDTASDAVITSLIPGVSQQLLLAIDRQDLTPNADYIDRICGRGQWKLYLKHYPVTEITSVTVNDEVIDEWDNTSTGTGWRFIGDDPNPENQQYIELISVPSYNAWPSSSGYYPYCYWPWSMTPNIVVEYSAGYDIIPPAIQQAAIDMIAFRRSMATILSADPIVTSVQMGDYSESLGGRTLDFMGISMPQSVVDVIQQYRRIVL
jgi:hypothetical protein